MILIVLSILLWIGALIALAILVEDTLIGLILAFVLAIPLLYIISVIATKHCPKCKKLGMVEVNKEEIDRFQTTKKVEDKIRNKKGEVIRTKTKEVPITMCVYQKVYKCKYCGHVKVEHSQEEKK